MQEKFLTIKGASEILKELIDMGYGDRPLLIKFKTEIEGSFI